MRTSICQTFLHLITLLGILLGHKAFSAEVTCRAVVTGESAQSSHIKIQPIVDGKITTVTIKDPVYPKLFAEGNIVKFKGRNVLVLGLLTRLPDGRRGTIRGLESLEAILKEFDARGIKIDAFMAHWNDYHRDFNGPSDNFIQFMQGYKDSLIKNVGSMKIPAKIIESAFVSDEMMKPFLQAAIDGANSTWSGMAIQKFGFNHIEAIRFDYSGERESRLDGQEGALDIQVIWSKTAIDHPIRFDADIYMYNQYEGSVLPRFHKMIAKVLGK